MLAILRGVHHADGVRLDGDAALALQIHGVEHLGLHFARGQRPGQLQQAVRQRGFAMINVSNDRKIAKKSGVHGCSGQCLILTGASRRQTSDLNVHYNLEPMLRPRFRFSAPPGIAAQRRHFVHRLTRQHS